MGVRRKPLISLFVLVSLLSALVGPGPSAAGQSASQGNENGPRDMYEAVVSPAQAQQIIEQAST